MFNVKELAKYRLESLGHYCSLRLLPGVLRPHDAINCPLRFLHYCHRVYNNPAQRDLYAICVDR